MTWIAIPVLMDSIKKISVKYHKTYELLRIHSFKSLGPQEHCEISVIFYQESISKKIVSEAFGKIGHLYWTLELLLNLPLFTFGIATLRWGRHMKANPQSLFSQHSPSLIFLVVGDT
jgi:hypothetical protein